ncbi:hypothetical protein DD559_12785 [Sphingomonas pokkalii]|uniref:Uncharacterized protein n=1 Tax=Sphingomonas pokkalii TaxID=2175090 RepID=A0A2U0SJI1_9SPHN|nr:hypothetical protein DD559_12785 [Sphingomonas pokkalii]
MADEYNGQQGDLWDPQKDMAIAMLGAALAAPWQWPRAQGDRRPPGMNGHRP